MKSFNLWVAAVATASLVSLTALAQTTTTQKCEPSEHHQNHDGQPGGPGDRKHFENDHLPAGLNLTDAQKKTLADARTAQEPAERDLHEKIRVAHDALRAADDANADEVTLTTLANNVASLMAQQEVARIKMHRQFLSILTPEQKQKLEAFKAEHKDAPRWKDKQKSAH
jgi:Spy/CpxP family protein refolding chaperone